MRKAARRDPNEIRESFLLALGAGVFIVWAVAVMASTFFSRPMDGQVHVIMLATVSGLFGGAVLAGRKADQNGRENGNGRNGA